MNSLKNQLIEAYTKATKIRLKTVKENNDNSIIKVLKQILSTLDSYTGDQSELSIDCSKICIGKEIGKRIEQYLNKELNINCSYSYSTAYSDEFNSYPEYHIFTIKF